MMVFGAVLERCSEDLALSRCSNKEQIQLNQKEMFI
jgi:hypothetical protein